MKTGKVCPLITRMNTNEYFAVNLILRHKIKLTASVSVLLVPISPFVDKKCILRYFVCFVDDNTRNGFKVLFNGYPKCRSERGSSNPAVAGPIRRLEKCGSSKI